MKMEKRTFLKLCGAATVTMIIPGIKLAAVKIHQVLKGAKPRNYPGKIQLLNTEKTGKRGDWQG